MTKLWEDLEAAMGQSGSDSPMFGCDYDGNDFIRDHAASILAMVEDAEREPVSWRIRIGDSDVWSYCTTESDADFYGRHSGLEYEKRAIYDRARKVGE